MKVSSLIVAFLCLVVACTAIAEPPPISAFARLEEIKSPSLSPDGRYLAYIGRVKNERVAIVTDIKDQSVAPRVVLLTDKNNEFQMMWCRWAKNTRLLCGYMAPQSGIGAAHRITRLIAVNADGTEQLVLLHNSDIVGDSQFQDQVLDNLPSSPDSVLIQASDGEKRVGYPSVFELNIYNGRLKKVVPAREWVWRYFSDGHGNVRLATGMQGKTTYYYARLDGKASWRELAKVQDFVSTEALIPMAIIPGTNKAYASGPNGDRRSLWIIDLEDKTPPQILFEHPIADVDNFMRDDDGNLLGIFYETDRPFVFYTDDTIGRYAEALKKILPDTLNVITSRSRDSKKLVIRAMSDREAGAFYLLDASTMQISRIGRQYPELDPAQLPRMRSIEYPASDGTKIPGYLTTPLDSRAEKLPLIVLPHGGPIARDSWDFDFLRHFLASRGYAVLQMNFRGSGGYGFKWQMAAHQDWGGLTYSDIVDGARWAVSQGIADPSRVCIVGWSFGGYAALSGAQRNADLFKCSVSIAGVSDLSALIKSQLRFIGGQSAWEQIGSDADKLKEQSPVRHAQDFKMPVLLLHGTLDAQAPYKQSEEMADALNKVGGKYKFVTIKNADHNLWREAERTTLLTEIEQFLNANIGPGVTTSARN